MTINGQGLLVDLSVNTRVKFTVGVDDNSTLNSITLTNDSNGNAYVDITAIKIDGVSCNGLTKLMKVSRSGAII